MIYNNITRGASMIRLLETAFKQIYALPVREQNMYAKNILEEVESEKKWDNLLSEYEQEILHDISNISPAINDANDGIGHNTSLKINL